MSEKPSPAVPIVFISSTAKDLETFRTAADQGVRTARCYPEMHQLWVARDRPPLDECLERVRNSDVVVVIVAHRYGWVPPDQSGTERRSITWLECEEAASHGKKVLAFIVDDTAKWPEEDKEEYRLVEAARAGNVLEIATEVQDNIQRLRAFKTWLQGRGIRGTFTNPEDLSGKVALALHDWKQRHPQFEPPGPPLPPPARDPAPYLQALREETGYIEIRGLRTSEGSAHRFGIADLYIPLVNELGSEDRPASEPDRLPIRERETKRGLNESLEHPRLVIVGDPGSGKTTFLYRIVWELCESRLGLPPRPNPAATALDPATLPVFIRISDLAGFLGKSTHSDDSDDSPMWIVRFLATKCEPVWGLGANFFLQQFQEGPCLLSFDGLDEAPDARMRERLSHIVRSAARVWPNCRMVVTTRPKAYTDEVALAGFREARIAGLDPDMIRIFLTRWSEGLYAGNPEKAARHASELAYAVESRPDIQRIAASPVMLTALAVLHWNEKRLPQQRAELYESILGWLSQSRKSRPGRLGPERCIALLQELAWAMQEHTGGRQVQVPREWAAGILAPRFREIVSPDEQHECAEAFLEQEELDSGIIVKRGPDVRFWHLTFQEHLAARALAGENDGERRRVLFVEGRGWETEWREVVLLLAGLLHQKRVERVDALVSAALDSLGRGGLANRLRNWLGGGPSLSERARCVSLLGAILFDLEPLRYKPSDPRFDESLRAMMGIFDREGSAGVPLRTRVEAAEALGQAGDPRIRGQNWIRIPAGVFVMGEDDEAHEVELSAYDIAKYPVTVEEFGRYVEDGGAEPRGWRPQLAYPNRPVVSVTWFDAVKYCQWARVRLPTEAEWERAARGVEGRQYPWGNEEPDATRANYDETKIGAPSPVGLFPNGSTPDGICDLPGNVWEWVADWYGDYPKHRQTNPTGPKVGESRVLRGGSWYGDSSYLGAAVRDWNVPGGRVNGIGFRCAREVSVP